MPRVSFTMVFTFLMGCALLGAFVISPAYTERFRFAALFIPISAPTYRIANWTRGRWTSDQAADTRDAQAVREENSRLRDEVVRLSNENRRLAVLAGDKESMGALSRLVDRFSVKGADPGNREGLTLAGSIFTDVKEGQPVIDARCLIGRIDRASAGSAHVKLVTDPTSIVIGRFVRFEQNGNRQEMVPVNDLPAIVEGIGNGQMHIVKLGWKAVQQSGPMPGDWVLANDPDLGRAQGLRIGVVESVDKLKQNRDFAEIRLRPEESWMHLSSVFVMTRQQDSPEAP